MVRRVFVLALNDLRQTLKDRPSFFWMIIMPVGFIFLFGQMGGGQRDTRIALSLVDEDQSHLSRHFAGSLERQGFVVRAIDPAQLDSASVVRRSISIPKGFQDSLASGLTTPVYYYVDPEADASASVVAEMHVMRASLSSLFTLSSATRDVPSLPVVVDSAFAGKLAAISAAPPKITVAAENAGRGRPVPSGMRQSLPATLALFMLINTTIYGAVYLAIEKQERILARIASQPISRLQILGGKLLGAILVALVQAGILLLAGRFVMHAYLGTSFIGLLLVIVCFALVCGSLALFWGAILRKPEQVTATTLVVSLFLGAIGGCWWPLEVVPSWMQAAGHISPAAWAMDGFHALISYGGGLQAVLLPCLVLLGYALVFLLIGARLLRFTD